ncbi:MAG: PAS domain-containing protein [Arcicella sp.]|nr:PAS domain-containing protein [Arcicella sp.]
MLEQEYIFIRERFLFKKEYLFEEDHVDIDARIRKQLNEDNSVEFEYRVKTNDGQIKWINEKNFGIRNDEGELIKISGICTDITEKKLAQTQIKQLSLVAEKTTNGVIITDVEGRVFWANQGFLDMLEISPESLYGKRPRDLFNPQTSGFSQYYQKKLDAPNYSIEVEVLT